MNQPSKKYSKGATTFKVLFLLLFVAFCGAVVYTKIRLVGDLNSEFNQTTRFKIGQYSLLRKIFKLNNDGDARQWYLSGTTPIIVEVAVADGVDLNQDTVRSFAQRMKKYLNRDILVFNFSTIDSKTLSVADLEEIANTKRRVQFDESPSLFIVYAQDFERQGTEVAKTFKEYGMVLSDKRLREVTKNVPSALPEYIESTLMHEFGHQLGLDHNQDGKCIMSEKAEKPNENGIFNGDYTPIEFCDQEKKELEGIIKKFSN